MQTPPSPHLSSNPSLQRFPSCSWHCFCGVGVGWCLQWHLPYIFHLKIQHVRQTLENNSVYLQNQVIFHFIRTWLLKILANCLFKCMIRIKLNFSLPKKVAMTTISTISIIFTHFALQFFALLWWFGCRLSFTSTFTNP